MGNTDSPAAPRLWSVYELPHRLFSDKTLRIRHEDDRRRHSVRKEQKERRKRRTFAVSDALYGTVGDGRNGKYSRRRIRYRNGRPRRSVLDVGGGASRYDDGVFGERSRNIFQKKRRQRLIQRRRNVLSRKRPRQYRTAPHGFFRHPACLPRSE